MAVTCKSDAVALVRWQTLWSAHPTAALISNARVESRGLSMRPTSGNDTYVTSLWDHYGRYPFDELRLLPPAQRRLAVALFTLARFTFPQPILRSTWLHENQPVSTPLWTRSLTDLVPPPGAARRGIRAPAPPGCIGLPSRIVWLRPPNTRPTRDNRRDARVERTAFGEWRPLNADADFDRAADLYRQLYLEKYSRLNPAYTATFLRALRTHELVEFEGLFFDRTMVGVVGTYHVGPELTTPIFGYDLTRPRDDGLYRRLAHRVLTRAAERGAMLHASAGAGDFKSHRGCSAHLEWIWIRPTRFSPGLHTLRLLARAILAEAQRRGL